MPDQIDSQRLIDSLIGQLNSDRFIGGRWLPMGKPQPKSPELPPQPHAANKTQLTVQEENIIATKKKKLAEIAERVAACTRCEISKTRLNPVSGQGNPNARIVFVGEAPGATEDEQGLPFVGRAGNLLSDIIKAMGLTRDDVYICNILKCRPPENRDPQAVEVANCQGYLHEQLQIIDPEIIIALGAHAAKTLLQVSTAIGQLRGQFHQYTPGEGAKPIKLMPTYHPSYLLRNYSKDNRKHVWEDMKKVMAELNLPVPGNQ